MYAVVATGGKQMKVEVGSTAVVEKIDSAVGESVELPVVLYSDGETIVAGPAALASASVTATIVEHFKGDKQIVFKFKKRKGYSRTKGHRQAQTRLLIDGISLSGASAPAPAKKAVVKEAAVETAAVEVGQCEALKSDGSRCANKAKDGSKYCGVHAKKFEGQTAR